MCQYDTFCFMSKKRKTRKDKEIADLRRTQSKPTPIVPSERPATFSFSTVSTPPSAKQQVKQAHPTYSEPIPSHEYVTKDVRKTLVITGSLILINAAVYIAIQANVIHLHFLGL